MSRSIGKSAAVAALIFGCGVAGLCSRADAGEPARQQAPALKSPISDLYEELRMALAAKVSSGTPPVRPPSEKEQQIFKRIVAGWQARHERIRAFSIAWDSRPPSRRNPYAGSPLKHTELWVEQSLRFRFLMSSPPDSKPYLETFDGMTHGTWNPETYRGEVWNGEPQKGARTGTL